MNILNISRCIVVPVSRTLQSSSRTLKGYDESVVTKTLYCNVIQQTSFNIVLFKRSVTLVAILLYYFRVCVIISKNFSDMIFEFIFLLSPFNSCVRNFEGKSNLAVQLKVTTRAIEGAVSISYNHCHSFGFELIFFMIL